MATDPSPIDATLFTNPDQACYQLATGIMQALTRQIFDLPSEPAPVGRLVQLPRPTTVLPREKPIPKPKPPTKWELFAARKGITKQKRSKLVWDEPTGTYKRRWGYDKANDDAEVPIIVAGPNDVPGEDPFTKATKDKKGRVARQEQQQLDNVKAAVRIGGKGAIPATLKLSASLPNHSSGNTGGPNSGVIRKRSTLKAELATASRQAAISTASIGKFDRIVANEKPDQLRRIPGAKKTKVLPVAATGQERAQQSSMVNQIIAKNADDIVDITRAIGLHEAAAREDTRTLKMKGANKKGRLTGGGRGGSGGRGGGGRGRGGDRGGGKSRAPPPSAGGRGGSGGRGGGGGRGGRGSRGGRK